MQASSTAAALILGGHEVTYSWTVQIDLPGGIYPDVTVAASAIELDFSTTTDQPDGTRLQEGYAAGQATFTLAGQLVSSDATKTAAWLFGRYSTTSPLYHSDAFMCPVRIYFNVLTPNSYGVTETYREFTGYVEDYTQDDDGNVSFTCLDARQLLRSVPAIPAVVTAPPYNAGLTSEFAVDALLRAATSGAISSWPAKRSGCVLAVGGRSSMTPQVGSLRGTLGQTPTFVPGVFGSAMSQSLPSWNLAGTVPGSGFVEWFSVNSVAGSHEVYLQSFSVGDAVEMLVTNTGSATTLKFMLFVATSAVGSATVTLAPSDTYIGVAFTWNVSSTAFSATVTTASGTRTASITATSARTALFDNCYLTLLGNTVEGLQVTTETSPATNVGFSPKAVIDPSLNPLQLVPAMSGDPWQVIQQIAEAELAVARFDESTGNFTFRNRDTIAATAVGRSVTSDASLETIGGVESTYASIVNDANVGYTTYTFTAASDGTPKIGRIWEASTRPKIPAGGSATFTVTLDSFSAVNVDQTFAVLADQSTDTANSYYRASVDRVGSSTFTGALSFAVTQSSASTFSIVVSNPNRQDAFLVSSASYTDVTAGTPLLWLAGQIVTQNDEQTVNYQWPPQVTDSSGNVLSGGAVTSRWGDIAWDGTGNPWIQDADAAAHLASDVVVANYLPLPNFTGLSISPDPRIQLTDKLLIDDTLRTGVIEYVQVFGYVITWQAGSPDTFEMAVDGRVIAPPGGGIIGYGSDVTSFATRNVIGTGSTPGSLYIAA